MDRAAKIYVAGHRGMVGSAIVRALRAAGHTAIVTRTSAELDLRDGAATRAFLAAERPAYVVMAAARVGGIKANSTEPYDFLYDNLAMAANVIDGSRRAGVRKLLFLGSSCIYPKLAPQPIREDSLLTGPLEVTNEAYAVAKIAGIKLCDHARAQYGCDFISAMPCNLYGPGDNFSLENSHVLPALIRKMHEAKLRGDASLKLWGTGTPLREFLHADDLAALCIAAGLARAGFITDLLSKPVRVGYMNGIGLTIVVSQLPKLLGNLAVKALRGDGLQGHGGIRDNVNWTSGQTSCTIITCSYLPGQGF